jgi:hypothetical protein
MKSISSLLFLAVFAFSTGEAVAKVRKQPQSKEFPALTKVVSMYCGVYGGTRVQITYSNPSSSSYYCHSVCYYSINGGAPTTLDCTASVAARTSNGLFCASNPYRNVRVTNAGSNNCP